MKPSSVIHRSICLLFAFMLMTAPAMLQAAESTADVAANSVLKEKLRKQIIGATAQAKTDEEYVIGYRDILSVSLFGEGSMTAGLPSTTSPDGGGEDKNFVRGMGSGSDVRMDGRISLKHIGDVYVVGMTLTQLADYLKKLYSSIYEDPSITVTLLQSNSRYYTIMGKVLQPGLYHLDFPMTIVNAVAKAGGFNEWANSEVTVIRPEMNNNGVPAVPSPAVAADPKTDKKPKEGNLFEFDYDDFLKGKDLQKNIALKAGDVIVVH